MRLLYLQKVVKVWMMVSSRAAQDQLLSSWSGVLFLLGKVIRFGLFFAFLARILASVEDLAGFNREQVIFFFLVYNLIDISLQFLFRGVYHFRFRVVRGEFDLDLLKPLPSYFRPLFGWTDILDLLTLVPLWLFFGWYIFEHQLIVGFTEGLLFTLLFINSLLIGFSVHLWVVSIGVMTMEIDHLVMVYRDLSNMAQFPTDIYQKGVRYFLTYLVPVVLMISVPAKALLGLLSWSWVLFSFAFGITLAFLSLRFWNYALSRYSSASS